jgi:hypothetical protein
VSEWDVMYVMYVTKFADVDHKFQLKRWGEIPLELSSKPNYGSVR